MSDPTVNIINNYLERYGLEKWNSLTAKEKSQYIAHAQAEINNTAKRVKTYTEAQARASRKYQSKTVAIQVRVTEEQREKYRQEAAALGLSLQKYIVYILEKEER